MKIQVGVAHIKRAGVQDRDGIVQNVHVLGTYGKSTAINILGSNAAGKAMFKVRYNW